MHDLLAQLLSQGLLDGWGDTDFDLPHLIKAVALLRRGVLSAALWELRQVERWEERHLKLLKACLGQDILLNALAEDHWGAFPWENQRSLDLMWGALLGPKIAHLYDYYASATRFATRVVGVEHGERWARAKGLKEGTPLLLVPEPANPYDLNAIHVFTPTGGSIGFLRRNLAAALAPRLATGTAASARVACILGETYPLDQRVNIRVELAGPGPATIAAANPSYQVSASYSVSVNPLASRGAPPPVPGR
ncbi:MAG: hypothetical protein PWR31_590 [Bacillota bacterium]|nr:hypothetical protein [Bacillota bacterium]